MADIEIRGLSKTVKSKKRNWSLIVLGVLMFVSIALVSMPISKIISNMIDQNALMKELGQARLSADMGYDQMMEEHLIKAQWAAKEKGVDIKEKVKEIYAKGANSIINEALSNALYGHMKSATYKLTKYKRVCSKAEIQPNNEKIAEIEMIIRQRD